MISYCHLKKNVKKEQGRPKIRPKLGRKFSKLAKIGKKIGIMCILTHKLYKKLENESNLE